jgi:hypothetical protein
MLPLRFSLGAFVFLALGAGAACSSSSNNASDGGTDDGSTSTVTPDATTPVINATCGLLAMAGGGTSMTCPAGQTCCTTLALPPSASCLPTSQCTGISNECSKGSDCASGQVCCGGSPDGGALVTDAAAATGAGGIPTFDMSQLNTTCQASCTATQTQECDVDAGDCPAGQTCQAAGGAGNPLATFIMLPNFCMAPRPDAGTPPVDSGSTPDDTGAPAPTPDAGDMVDVAAGD